MCWQTSIFVEERLGSSLSTRSHDARVARQALSRYQPALERPNRRSRKEPSLPTDLQRDTFENASFAALIQFMENSAAVSSDFRSAPHSRAAQGQRSKLSCPHDVQPKLSACLFPKRGSIRSSSLTVPDQHVGLECQSQRFIHGHLPTLSARRTNRKHRALYVRRPTSPWTLLFLRVDFPSSDVHRASAWHGRTKTSRRKNSSDTV